MQFVRLTGANFGDVAIPIHCVVAISARRGGGSTVYHSSSEDGFAVTETVDEIIQKIDEITPKAHVSPGMIAPGVHDMVHRSTYTGTENT